MSLERVIDTELGQLHSANDVAQALHKRVDWVYRNAETLGGLKIGGEWQFFEKNIVQALRPTACKGGCFAGKTDEQKDGKSRMVREDNPAGRSKKGKETSHSGEGHGVGSLDEAEVARTLEADPEGLLA